MKDILNQLYGNNGCTVIKMAQPVNKNTPKAIQELGFVHYEKDKNKTYDAAIKEFKEMSDIDYEYSRLGIYCAIEHIMEDIHEVKSGFGQLVSFKSATDVFVGLFSNMQAYFDEVKQIKTKKISKKMLTAEIEAITSYVEGVLFLKEVAKKDSKLMPLIAQYETVQQELLTLIESHQQTFKLTKSDYKIIEATDIVKAAKEEMELSMKFNYNSLNYDDLERILIAVGDKKKYWHALQDVKKWETLYEDNLRQSLSQYSLEQLRSQLPLMLEQYKSLHHLSFTNMVKVLLVASSYYGSLVGSRNEKAPKDDKEFKEHEMMRDKDFEMKKKESFYTPIRKEIQTPERTLENLQFASEILAASMTVSALIDNACGLTDSNQDCLVLERFNDQYDIVKLTNSDLAILLTKDQTNIHGDLVNVIDLENSNMQSCIKKKAKGSSFSGMTNFLREIKEPFVQEYFFGKRENVLNFVDKRS
jgi:hypothetical protein